MRTIDRSGTFRRDYKRELSNPNNRDLSAKLPQVLTAIANDLALPSSHRDHALTGPWLGYRECHVKPDVLLIYRKVGRDGLYLARLGSHSLLFRK